MILLHRSIIFAFLFSFSSSCVSRPSFKHRLASKLGLSKYRELRTKQFARLAALVLTNAKSLKGHEDLIPGITEILTQDEGREEFVLAVSTIFALALANGLHSLNGMQSESFDFVTNHLANADPKTIASALSKYIIPIINEPLAAVYKKNRAAGKSPAEAMSLAMEAKWPLPKTQTDPDGTLDDNLKCLTPTLGCEFDDDEYSYRDDRRVTKRAGGQTTLTPIKFLYKWFRVFNGGVQDAYSLAMETTRYNDVNQLIRFVSEFKHQKDSLENFYDSYKYKFRPLEDTAVFELKFITWFEKYIKGISKFFYLITVYRDIPENYSISDFERLSEDLPQGFIHGDVAGAVNLETSGIRGVIILDLSLGVKHPIIIHEEKPAIRGNNDDTPGVNVLRASSTLNDKIIEYELVKVNGKPFVVAKVYENGDHSKFSTHVYDVRKPYCAFLKKTYKPNLVMPDHGMFTRQKDGIKRAELTFSILPRRLLQSEPYFNVISYAGESEDVQTIRSAKIMFKDLNNMTEEQKGTMAQVIRDLEMPEELFWGKLAAVKLLIVDDDDLLEQMFELNKKLHFIDQTEAQDIPGEVLPWIKMLRRHWNNALSNGGKISRNIAIGR